MATSTFEFASPRRFSGLPPATLPLLAAVVLGMLAMALIARASLTGQRDGPPVELLHQQRGLADLALDMSELLGEVEALRAEPSRQGVDRVRRRIDATLRRLRAIGELDGSVRLAPVSPLLEALGPPLGEVARWLEEGLHGLPPEAPEVLARAAESLADARRRFAALHDGYGVQALDLMRRDARGLARLNDVLAIVVAFGGLLILVIVLFVARHQRAEAGRLEAQLRLRDSIDAISDGLALFDSEGRLVIRNRAYGELFPGLEDRLVPGARYEALLSAASNSGRILDAEGREADWVAERMESFRRPRGSADLRLTDGRWYRLVERRTDDGGVVATSSEITEARRRESELRKIGQDMREDKLLLDAALGNMSHGLAMFDIDHCLIVCNQQFLRLYGLPEALGRPGVELERILRAGPWLRGLTPEIADREVAKRLAAARAGRTARWRDYLADGGVIEISYRPLPNGGSLATFEDVSEHHRSEAELRAAKEEAEIANRAKSEFLANISHELRTPLNAIIGFSEMMEGEMFGPLGDGHYREYAKDIHVSGHHLLSLINDILDLSKIEAGKLVLSEEELGVAEVISASVRLVRQRAEAAGVELSHSLPPGLPRLYADQRAMKQILINLLANAVKYTAAGGRVAVGAELAASGELAFFVNDTGIGMSGPDIEKALSPFGQVDSSMTRKYEGTGLGLPLSQHLVVLHGGRLAIESEPGVGTRVRVYFPASRLRRAGVAGMEEGAPA